MIDDGNFPGERVYKCVAANSIGMGTPCKLKIVGDDKGEHEGIGIEILNYYYTFYKYRIQHWWYIYSSRIEVVFQCSRSYNTLNLTS